MKRRWTAVILALFGGAFGLHRFYLRQPEIGVVYIFLMILNFTRFPLSAILGWYDAYRYLMMNENEFDRKYNSQNFRDRYGNRRTEPRVQETRRGKYILMDEDNVTTQGRTGYFDLIKSIKQSESYKQTGIKKFKDYDIKGSIEDFKKALELNSQDKALHFNLACAYSMEEEATKALIHLDHAVAYGFQEFDRILSHESLAYIRVFPEFEAFKNNQYRLTSSIVQSLEQRIKAEKELELEKLKSEKIILNQELR